MLFSRKRRAKIVPLRIAKEEWTAANADLTRAFVGTDTFRRLKSVLHAYLLQHILGGESEDYRRGYMTAVEQISAFGNELPAQEDDDKQTTMQDVETVDFL